MQMNGYEKQNRAYSKKKVSWQKLQGLELKDRNQKRKEINFRDT